MQRFNLEVPSEYVNGIQKKIDGLKQYERDRVGEILAVLKKSESLLGRPADMVDHENDAIYCVYAPTKLGVICQRDMDIICDKEDNIKLISFHTLAKQLFEFNFTYSQMLLNRDSVICETPKFHNFRIEYLKCFNSNEFKIYAESKLVATALSVMQTIKKGKLEGRGFSNRVFFLNSVVGTLRSMYGIEGIVPVTTTFLDIFDDDKEVIDKIGQFLGQFTEGYQKPSAETKAENTRVRQNMMYNSVLPITAEVLEGNRNE